MPVSFIGSSTTGTGYGVTSISEPGGCADGDLLVIAAGFFYDVSSSVATPSGWTALDSEDQDNGGGTAVKIQLFWRIRSGAASDVAVGPSGGSGGDGGAVMLVFRGVDGTTPIQATVAKFDESAYTLSPTYTPSTLTVARADSMLASAAMMWGTPGYTPAGTGHTFTSRSTALGGGELTSHTAPIASAGSVGTWTGEVNNPGVGVMLVVQPPDSAVDVTFSGAAVTHTATVPQPALASMQPVTMGGPVGLTATVQQPAITYPVTMGGPVAMSAQVPQPAVLSNQPVAMGGAVALTATVHEPAVGLQVQPDTVAMTVSVPEPAVASTQPVVMGAAIPLLFTVHPPTVTVDQIDALPVEITLSVLVPTIKDPWPHDYPRRSRRERRRSTMG